MVTAYHLDSEEATTGCHDYFSKWIEAGVFASRGANETRQLASYSNSTWSKVDSSELDSS